MDKPLLQALSPKRAKTPTSPPFRRLPKDRKKAMYFYGLRKAQLIENVRDIKQETVPTSLPLQWLTIHHQYPIFFPDSDIKSISLTCFSLEQKEDCQTKII